MSRPAKRTGSARAAFARRSRWRVRSTVLSALLALGGCAIVPLPLPGSGARPTPIADRPIDLDGVCVQTEEDGFREDARISVRNNEVRALAWRMQIGRRGSCSFDQAEFRQTKRRPHIELLARDGSGCRLMIWQEPRRVTLAHAGCENRCTPGVYEQAWPAMFDPSTGRCARP